jgi:glycolate oxidase iron-sulfur subunit
MYPALGQWSETLSGIGPEILTKRIDLFQPQTSLEPWLQIEYTHSPKGDLYGLLFPGCIARCGKSLWETRAEALLELLGVSVLPRVRWECCGFTLGAAGLRQEQKKARQHNLQIWRQEGRPAIFCFCETCLHALVGYVSSDLDWEPGEREQWQQAVRPLSSVLHDVQMTVLKHRPVQGLVLHQSCHSRSSLWDWLLQRSEQLDFPVQSLNLCCGLGGSMQLEHFEYTQMIGRRFWNHVEQNPTQLLSGCSGCVLQLARYKPQFCAVGHWLEILDI